ncbi:DNA mismatch repair protein MutS [Xanthovirga aplysinae]|uniref:DNA mismatch repair protein MutS n=1 Tax=Xanthovirga aplysinae TaxID=2529853 RepID=UPI0012BC7E5A|nr:DNA mismatch repair protein MutS [Xanthovirga aplysinae]MTI29888.1 DNA mismatch repair protein MutS [Xanthovirga aplysinae]
MAKTKSTKGTKETPLMKQYNAIKAKYPGALLLFRVGDFYETFGEDAIKASKVLDIVLTKRANGAASHIELAGFPHHSLDSYLPKLVRAGNRVAICDQLEDPKTVKGIVKRGVTELVTPGLSFNDNVLEKRNNNYLASIHFAKNDQLGIAFLDLSTGEFMVSQGSAAYVDKLMQGFNPSEVIYSKACRPHFEQEFQDKYITYCLEDWVYAFDFAYESLTSHFKTKSLKGFGIEKFQNGVTAAGAVLYYLEETEHKEVNHISSISRIEEEKYVWLDKFTIQNLELLFPQQEGGIPLIEVMDKTVTPMGARQMKKWMVLPLKDKTTIEERLQIVEAITQNDDLQEDLLQHLKHIGDLERLISKVAVKRINPREMNQLKKALKNTIPVQAALAKSGVESLIKMADQLNSCEFLLEKIEKELKEDAPMLVHQGSIIQDGVNEELDEWRKIAFSGKDYLTQIQQREGERTGITSLKIAYNKVFGYYLEVTHAHKDKVPEEWIRKQTLVNAERYITPELKEYEEKILQAESKLSVLEQKLFADLVHHASDYVTQVQQNARILAVMDCLLSFAQTALKNKYVKPQISEGRQLEIKAGRHPVIEQQLPLGESYVPNDVFLDSEQQQIMIITGPNMAGKSALLRQTALIVLMAQMGAFVPAESATIGLIDKVFTRVGASDNLSRGESTFMVEMTETASILNNLSDRSLVLMDEIGRGTSTYDGISIAWSIVEYLHNHPEKRAKTLFATHYHELNQLTEDFPRIKNFNVSVKEVNNKVVFMRKLKEGGSEHSFGIHVAQLAGMPNEVVLRANEIMHHLEKDKVRQKNQKRLEEVPKNNFQLSLFDAADPRFEMVKEFMSKIDINRVSPVEALLKLNELKSLMEE